MRMGLPCVLLSDNGSEFCNELNDQLAKMLGIKRRLTTPSGLFYFKKCYSLIAIHIYTHLSFLILTLGQWS